MGGDEARLNFGGTPTVFDNFGSKGKTQQMNLVLSEDSNAVINTTANGLSDGIIGVYVVESADQIFTGHGLPGKPFGTFGDVDRSNPQVFRSDHALSLYGVRNENDANDSTIYWVDVICKLTTADDNDRILYQDIHLTINGKRETRKGQAVYARITEYDDQEAIQNGFNALRDGFDAAQDTLYTRDGDSFDRFPQTAQTVVKLKMLKDAELDKNIQVQGTRMVTFTTAETQGSQTMRDRGDFFLFGTDRTDAERKALIERAFDGSSMIQDKVTALTLTNIVLDGGAEINVDSGVNTGKFTTSNGGIVNVTAGKLIVDDGAVLRNSTTTANGGAVYVANGATLDMKGNAAITGNTVSAVANGGGVYIEGSGTGDNATYGTVKVQGSVQITNNTAGNNASNLAIYGDKSLVVDGNLTANADIGICTEKEEDIDQIGVEDSVKDNLDKITYDLDTSIHAVAFGTKKVVWSFEPVCMLTADSSLLYRNEDLEPCVYMTLKEGFADAAQILYERNSSLYADSQPIALEMLKDYTMGELTENGNPTPETIEFLTSRDLTFTTASEEKQDFAGNKYAFQPAQNATGDGQTKATVTRGTGNNAASLFNVATSTRNFTVTNLILDGHNVKLSAINGGIFHVTSGMLAVEDGAVLRNSATTGNGGAVYVAANAMAEMTGGEITGNEAANGGAVYVAAGATMEMKNDSVTSGGTVTATHGTINGNTAATAGAGIYLEEDSKLKL